jgi:hypothetical protein
MRASAAVLMVLATGCSSGEPVPEPSVSTQDRSATVLPPASEGGTPYRAPADPNAEYILLDVKQGERGRIIAVTRRTSSSGVSYSRREIDCDAQLARYVGEGETRAETERMLSNPGEMAPLVEGSSTHAAVQAACGKR